MLVLQTHANFIYIATLLGLPMGIAVVIRSSSSSPLSVVTARSSLVLCEVVSSVVDVVASVYSDPMIDVTSTESEK